MVSTQASSNDSDLGIGEVHELINAGDLSADQPINFSKQGERYYYGCCKVCTTGCACGNSCISCSYNCTKPRGCACDG